MYIRRTRPDFRESIRLLSVSFVAQKRIPPIYLADAVVEAFIIAAWVVLLFMG